MVILFLKDNLISVISLLISAISAFYAFYSTRIAKKAYKLSEKEFQNKQANFTLYLAESYYYERTVNNDSTTYFIFNILITNKSENQNTYNANLLIDYSRPDSSMGKVILEHSSESITNMQEIGITPFPNNIIISGKESSSNWLIFKKPPALSKNYRIKKYSIQINDTDKNEKLIDVFILKQMANEKN